VTACGNPARCGDASAGSGNWRDRADFEAMAAPAAFRSSLQLIALDPPLGLVSVARRQKIGRLTSNVRH